MSEVVNAWQLSPRRDNAAFLKQGLKSVSQSRAAISSSTPGGVPDQSRIRGNGKFPFSSGTQAFFYLIGNRAVDGKETRFIKLGLSNVKGQLPRIVIPEFQSQQLAAADSRGKQ
jgi:hypothetical protein